METALTLYVGIYKTKSTQYISVAGGIIRKVSSTKEFSEIVVWTAKSNNDSSMGLQRFIAER